MSGIDHVIVADSDVLVRHALAEFLRDCGFRVVETANSEEVVAVLGQSDLGIDIVLADSALGGELGGFGLRRWVRDNAPGIDVVMAAGDKAQADVAAELCEKGPDLTLPYDPQLVVERIRQLRGRRDRTSESAPSPAS